VGLSHAGTALAGKNGIGFVIMGEKYFVISCHVLWRELCYYASISRNVFNFMFLKQGLHDTPNTLREMLQNAIDSVDGDYTAILIGYGLCCNGLAGITARNTKLVIMRGHDCITFFLGSKERYQEYFDRNPGTYWYSPGWIDTVSKPMPGKERLEQFLQLYRAKYGEENAEYLMQIEQQWIKEYSQATYVDFGFYVTTIYKDYTKKCAQELGWSYDELKGDPHLILYFLEGNWNNDDFLIVNQGEKVVATHDERIIDVQK